MQRCSATAAHCVRTGRSQSPKTGAKLAPGAGEPRRGIASCPLETRSRPVEVTKTSLAKSEAAKKNPAPLHRARRGLISGPSVRSTLSGEAVRAGFTRRRGHCS
jgi:hypothetical protein